MTPEPHVHGQCFAVHHEARTITVQEPHKDHGDHLAEQQAKEQCPGVPEPERQQDRKHCPRDIAARVQ